MPTKKNPTGSVVFLIVLLIAFVAIAIMFLPGVNENIANSLKEIQAVDTHGSNEVHTIFQTLTYNRSIHVLAMLLLGFGFLMVFVRKHGFSSITATLLVTSISIPVYMLIKSFVSEEPQLEVEALLWGEFAAASLLIAIGAPLGRLKMSQYVVMAALFTIVYFFNEWLVLESGAKIFQGFQDTGGSVVIHAFGAYFGLGVIATTRKKFEGLPECESDKTTNQFCLLGSFILWVFWPSFTSAVAAPERVVLTAINTVFALAAASVATYIFSKLIRGKLDVEDIANAALAGGVAIGSTCDIATPGSSMLIGLAAGTLSTLGYSVIAPKVCNLIKGDDTCGVHNLHGMPGLMGGISAIFVAKWGGIVGFSVGSQLISMLVTVVIAFVGGRIVGLIIGCMGRKEVPYSDEDEFILEEE